MIFRADRNYDFDGCLMRQKREFCGTWWSGFSFLFLWAFKVIIVPHCLIEVCRKIVYFLSCVYMEWFFRICLNMVWFGIFEKNMSEFSLICQILNFSTLLSLYASFLKFSFNNPNFWLGCYDYGCKLVLIPKFFIPHAIWYVYTWRSLAPSRQPRDESRQNKK